MVEICSKGDCVACGACVVACPKKCISMVYDQEGFLYPNINQSDCIDCGLCRKVCLISGMQEKSNNKPLTFACVHRNKDIRMQSSSGGSFSAFAEQIINENGIVFGAQFNSEWEVVHASVDNLIDLEKLKGSKYVQSKMGEIYFNVQSYLKNNKKVLFSGTPCQIAGLKKFLRREYENLITIDLVCHGVPSPQIFKLYLLEHTSKIKKFSKIEKISFRDKRNGWKNYSFYLKSQLKNGKFFETCESNKRNLYMRGYLENLLVRPSCYNCPTKGFSAGSDITIGDFWGVENILPRLSDNNGVSVIFITSDKGKKLFELVKKQMMVVQISFEDGKNGNSEIDRWLLPHPKRDLFFKNYSSRHVSNYIKYCLSLPFKKKVILYIRKCIVLLFGKITYEHLKNLMVRI
ncbi:MAG: 4Fe-4S dicluster domain-containing protein [Fibrobacter sp.]|nr:4Fe-4S dicluster domain-containing protein [Fibrobacter sp.]